MGALGGTDVPGRCRQAGTTVPIPALIKAFPSQLQQLGTRLAPQPMRPFGGPRERQDAMDRLDQFFGIHGDALRLRSERMTLLASNIANAATPGYKARDLDFASALQGELRSGLKRTDVRHLDPLSAEAGAIRFRKPIQPSLDGNTVELATEQLQFAETALRYRSTLGILNGRISSLTAALKGE
jgi:flagellar basal-body rod protein FlgB